MVEDWKDCLRGKVWQRDSEVLESNRCFFLVGESGGVLPRDKTNKVGKLCIILKEECLQNIKVQTIVLITCFH